MHVKRSTSMSFTGNVLNHGISYFLIPSLQALKIECRGHTKYVCDI